MNEKQIHTHVLQVLCLISQVPTPVDAFFKTGANQLISASIPSIPTDDDVQLVTSSCCPLYVSSMYLSALKSLLIPQAYNLHISPLLSALPVMFKARKKKCASVVWRGIQHPNSLFARAWFGHGRKTHLSESTIACLPRSKTRE